MPKKSPVVDCIFALEGKALSKILEESFRLYLHRILVENAEAAIQ